MSGNKTKVSTITENPTFILVTVIFTVASIGILAYIPITGFHLELEDYMVFQASATKENGVFWPWTPEWSNYFRPVEWLYYDSAYTLFGLQKETLYGLSIIHQILNAVLVYVFINVVFQERFMAFFTAVIFVAYPTSWEAVSWIAAAGHRMVLTNLLISFIFTGLYFRKRSTGYLVSMLVFLLVSLCTREQAILAFPVILFIHWYLTPRPFNWKLEAKPYFWIIPIFALYGIFQLGYQIDNRLVESGKYGFSLAALSNLIHLFVNIFIPNKLAKSVLNPDTVVWAKTHWAIFSSLFFVVAASFLAILFAFPATRKGGISFLHSRITWFAAGFVLVQLTVYSLFSGGGASSRYTYIAGVGASLLIANIFMVAFQVINTRKFHASALTLFILMISLNILNVRLGLDTFRERTNAVEKAFLDFDKVFSKYGNKVTYHFINPPYPGHAWAPAASQRFSIPIKNVSAWPGEPAEEKGLLVEYHKDTGFSIVSRKSVY